MALFKKKKKEPNKIYTLDELNIGTEGMSEEEIARLEAEAVLEKYDKESAYRNKIKGPVAFVLGLIMIAFSLFQIYTSIWTIPPQILRSIHLAFVLILVYLLYPAHKGLRKDKIAWYDVVLGLLALAAVLYIPFNYEYIVKSVGNFGAMEIIAGLLGMVLLMEACRRVVGLPILIIVLVFLAYAVFGKYIPGSFGHRGYSVKQVVTHMYFTLNGVFGTPLGVSSTYIFLFILFGSFLEKTGVGKLFIDLANALAGKRIGGPAKVAVIASALEGTVSGSSVANTVGSGSFTIPTMKKLGYSPEFAGAVEAAASTGGQIMPPIMGAAAFLMAEYMNVTYGQVTLWAILPAVLYFGGIFISVHLEAKKLGLKGIPRSELPRFKYLMRNVYLLLPLVFLIWVVTANIRSLQYAASIAILISIAVSLVGTIRDAAAEVHETKRGSTVGVTAKKTGLMILEALEAGGKGSITVAVACSMAGMIAGCITVTGLASKLISGVVALSSKIPNPTLSLLLALFLTMLCCIVLGMGVPTTANYCIMASTCAPILITLGIPKIAAHFFVFYFGIVADITPPVALAAYAGSAIAKSDPMKTGINATKLAIAAFIVPYIFAMNPSMLLMDQGVLAAIQVIITSCLGIFGIAAALEGYVVARAPWWQRILLAAGGLCLIDPSLMTDIVGVAAIVIVVVLQIVMRKRSKPVAA